LFCTIYYKYNIIFCFYKLLICSNFILAGSLETWYSSVSIITKWYVKGLLCIRKCVCLDLCFHLIFFYHYLYKWLTIGFKLKIWSYFCLISCMQYWCYDCGNICCILRFNYCLYAWHSFLMDMDIMGHRLSRRTDVTLLLLLKRLACLSGICL
jgi:hypothetical protein